MLSETRSLLIRLKTLVQEAGNNYYERIKIATTILTDREWIAAEFGGKEEKACETLEHEYFHDLCGAMDIWSLLQIYRKFPEEADWKKYDYHLTKLYEASKLPSAEKAAPRRHVKIKEFEKLEQEKKALQLELRHRTRELAQRDQTIASMEEKIVKLERENERLHGKVEELEKIVHGKLRVRA